MEAYHFIRNAILEGDFEPGQRLTEEFLAEELRMSRTPIREALKKLETEGLVTPLKRGVSVRTFSPEDIRQIYDLRALLEGYAASQAALFRSNVDLQKFEEIHRQYEQEINELDPSESDDIKAVAQLNNQFHQAVVTASHNNYLEFLVSRVVVLPLVFRSFYWYDKPSIVRSMHDHRIIWRAIEDQDPDRAKTAMMEHIYRGKDHVLRHISTPRKKEDEK